MSPSRPRRWDRLGRCAAGLVACALWAGDSSASPATFVLPAPNPGWVVVLHGGAPLADTEGDAAGPRDAVGDAANPMLYIASDAQHLYFRLRLDEDPLQTPTSFKPFGWGCFLSTDADLTTYELSALVNGVGNPDEILVYVNTVTVTPNDPTDAPDLPPADATPDPLAPLVLHAEVVSAPSMFGGTPDFFLDWAVELSAAQAAGFDPAAPASYYCGSSNNGSSVDADCSGSAAGGCPLDSQFSDPIACGASGCAICGDGSVGPGEGCDDGNLVSGDGCSGACAVEAMPACGDGALDAAEECDDQNTVSGDGCSASCVVERGFACDGEPSVCMPVGCASDAECMNGQVCDEATSTCVECTTDAECADSAVCDGATQTCVECLADSDCPADLVCDGEVHGCVECLADSDCPADLVCDAAVHACEGCEQTGTCGCVTDADCAPPLICDVANGACEPTENDEDEDRLVAEGSGCFCAAQPRGRDGRDGRALAMAALGLVGLYVRRRRR